MQEKRKGLKGLTAKFSRFVGDRPGSRNIPCCRPAIVTRYDDHDLLILKRLYGELAHSGLGISKQTFMDYFNLTGMHGERMFELFNTKNSSYLSYDDWISGLNICEKGTKSEKISLLFRLFDLNNDKKITRQDITTLLNNSPDWARYILKSDEKRLTTEVKTSLTPLSSTTITDEYVVGAGPSPVVAEMLARAQQDGEDEAEEINVGVNRVLDRLCFTNEISEEEFRTFVDRYSGILILIHRFSVTNNSLFYPLKTLLSNSEENFERELRVIQLFQGGNSIRVGPSEQQDTFFLEYLDIFSSTNEVEPLPHSDRKDKWACSLSCPRCNNPLLLCHQCGAELPQLHVGAESVVIECVVCNAVASQCWFCQWVFSECLWENKNMSMEGVLYKQNRGIWTEYRFVLQEKLLYYYNIHEYSDCVEDADSLHWISLDPVDTDIRASNSNNSIQMDSSVASSNPSAEIPVGFIYLESCFVEAISTQDGPFGEGIDHYGICLNYRSLKRVLYANSLGERDSWLAELKKVLHQQPIQTLYEMHEIIGHGKFSTVYRAQRRNPGDQRKDDENVAVKVINRTRMSDDNRDLLRSEVNVLKLLNHPNVVALRHVITSREQNKDMLYIVMEYIPGGELWRAIDEFGPVSEDIAHRLMVQLLKTIEYLHRSGILHRDLKCENILLTEMDPRNATIKIADFGLACLCGPSTKLTQPCGTITYVAPEVLTMEGYGQKADVWSLGVILHLMLTGKLPFPVSPKSVSAKEQLYSLNFGIERWETISKTCQDFLQALLTVDVSRRPSCEEALEHIWIKAPAAVIKN